MRRNLSRDICYEFVAVTELEVSNVFYAAKETGYLDEIVFKFHSVIHLSYVVLHSIKFVDASLSYS